MPSEPMNIQEQGFRSSLFGFDKNDVLAYMNALANEAQQHELEYNRQLQQLQSKLDELRSERGTADSRMEALKAELAAATQRADTAEAKRREADEQLETSIAGARGVIINITSSPDIGLEDVETAASMITQSAHPDANIIWGTAFDERLSDCLLYTSPSPRDTR